MLDRIFFRVRHKMDCRLVLVLGKVSINAVVADIELAADKPFPARCIAGIKDGMPFFVPVQQIGIFGKTVGEIIQTEPIVN